MANFVDGLELKSGEAAGGRRRGSRLAEYRAPPWQPEQSGNPEQFLSDLRDAWEKHGPRALEACAIDDPTGFVRTVAGLMPRHIDLSVGVDATQFVSTFRQALELLGNEPRPVAPRRRNPKVIEAEVIDVNPD